MTVVRSFVKFDSGDHASIFKVASKVEGKKERHVDVKGSKRHEWGRVVNRLGGRSLEGEDDVESATTADNYRVTRLREITRRITDKERQFFRERSLRLCYRLYIIRACACVCMCERDIEYSYFRRNVAPSFGRDNFCPKTAGSWAGRDMYCPTMRAAALKPEIRANTHTHNTHTIHERTHARG